MNRAKIGKLTQSEAISHKVFNFKIFIKFFKLGSKLKIFISIFLLLLYNVLSIYNNFWVSTYTIDNQGLSVSNYFLIYIMMCILQILIKFIFSIIITYYYKEISRNIFRYLVLKILRKKLQFFDQTPQGQIMNYFSKDLSIVDESLIYFFTWFVEYLFLFIGTFILIIVNNYILIILIVLTLMVYFFITRIYLRISLQFRKLTFITTSPCISNLQEAIQGYYVFNVMDKFHYIQEKYRDNFNKQLQSNFHD